MTIDRLRNALSATGPPPDARELSEMLWLACHLTPPAEPPEDGPEPDPPSPVRTAPSPPPPRPSVPREPVPERLSPLHPRAVPKTPGTPETPGTGAAGEAAEVLVPTAPMLADPLGVQRALRPLKRRVPSGRRLRLDEDATAARVADTGVWTPVLVPEPERWLSLTLVVDTGPTMRLWRPLARELAEALLRQGAFQDVHVGYLGATGGVAAAPDAPRQDPGTLLDASGRRAVLVLSDCSGSHWWDGRAARAVRRWARAGPTAILQPLAERLWRRTAAPAAPGVAVLPRPGAPNADLRFVPYDGIVGPGLHVPVLEAAPRWFGAWARLVAGSDPQPAAVATLPARPSAAAPVRRERELPVDERVRRFLAGASADAAELAAHVAVSVPSLPVMRLIQHRILGGSGPGQLAEVLLSGLLRPVGGVRYEFVPGAREALLDTLPRPEALHTRHVLEAVSAEIERRAGTAGEHFRALLPTEGGPLKLTADTDHFALLTPETRTTLAPGPAAAPNLLDLLAAPPDDLLDTYWDRFAPMATSIGVNDDGGTTDVDIRYGGRGARHGMITGPPRAVHEMLRTILLSSAITYSPNWVNFALFNCADFYMGPAGAGLSLVPHTAAHVPNLPLAGLGDLSSLLEDEKRRRKAILADAAVPTWDAYQTATRYPALDPLPVLIIIVGIDRRLLESDPDLPDRIAGLTTAWDDVGFRFVFYPIEESAEVEQFRFLSRWRVEFDDSADGGHATLGVRGMPDVRFRPAHISSADGTVLTTRMERRGLPARVLSLRPEQERDRPEPTADFDILQLNGAGPDDAFREIWALPATTPRNTTIGHHTDGNALTFYPFDLSSGIPHGLIVGTAEARQRIARAIALALAAGYSPPALKFTFAGMGEHPLGDPLPLPHVRHSESELLGRPDQLRRFLDYLSGELDGRATDPAADHRRLVVFADVSLTFPSSRRDVGETLLALAQRGRSLGVQLVLSAETVENTTIWNRFLPLVGWRMAASNLPPAVLQRVLGRPTASFPDERTAYLLADGGVPHQLVLAPEPPPSAVQEFIERAGGRPAMAASAPPTGEEDAEDQAIREILLRFYVKFPGARRVAFEGTKRARMVRAAHLYGRLLRGDGQLSSGEVREVPLRASVGPPVEALARSWPELFQQNRGRVLLVHLDEMRNFPHPLRDGFPGALSRTANEHADDPLVVVCGSAPAVRAFRQADPSFDDQFHLIVNFGEPRLSDPAAPIPIGVDSDTGEPVTLDFAADRHLLISGPPHSGKATLLSYLRDEIRARTGGGPLHEFDADDLIPGDDGTITHEAPGETSTAREFSRELRKAIDTAARQGLTARDRDAFLLIRNHWGLFGDEPFLPLPDLLRSSSANGLRLLLSHHGNRGVIRSDLVGALRETGAPVLLMGTAENSEAEPWGVPSTLRRPIPRGQALLAYPDRRRFVTLRLTTRIGSGGT